MKNYTINLFFLSLFLLVLSSGCSENESGPGNGTTPKSLLTPESFLTTYESTPSAILLDVRTPQEIRQGALPNSTAMNYHDNNFEDQLKTLDKTKAVFVYCQSGVRSAKTCLKLKQNGFDQVFDMKGGYNAWKKVNK